MPDFEAQAQYDDWKGSAAADNSDQKNLGDYLKANNFLEHDKFIVGFEIDAGAAFASTQHFSASIYTVDAEDFEGALKATRVNPANIQKKEIDISLNDFFSLFKRFNVIMTKRGLNIVDVEFPEC